MVFTLELPIPAAPFAATINTTRTGDDPLHAYAERFGALPAWFDEISAGSARTLARQALRRGVPLTPADYLS